MNKVFTESAPPAVPEVPLYGGSTDPQDAPWSLVLSSLSDLSKFVKNEMVTRNHLDSYHRETIEVIEARVQEAIAPLQEGQEYLEKQMDNLTSRIEVIENASATGSLTRSSSERPRATDTSQKTIVFKGVPTTMSAEQRIREIENFMATHFPNIRLRDVGNFYKGPYPKGRMLTNVAYAELSNSDVRREVLEKIGPSDKIKIKCVLGGTEVRIRKALTEHAVQRNAALRRASDLLKADKRFKNSSITIEWSGERGITIDKAYVFVQRSSDVAGEFVGPCSDLRLP